MKTPRIPIALKLPYIVALLIVFARRVVEAISKSTWFAAPNPLPTPALAQVTLDIDALETAEVAVRSGLKGAAAVRDGKRKTVEDDMKALKTYVYGIAAVNAGDAIAIILAAGMLPMHFAKRDKLPLEALMGPIPHEVILRAKSVRKRASYEWQYSADGGKTWLAMGTTTVADHSIQGLTLGATYLFRFRVTIKKETRDWSQIISFVVH